MVVFVQSEHLNLLNFGVHPTWAPGLPVTVKFVGASRSLPARSLPAFNVLALIPYSRLQVQITCNGLHANGPQYGLSPVSVKILCTPKAAAPSNSDCNPTTTVKHLKVKIVQISLLCCNK